MQTVPDLTGVGGLDLLRRFLDAANERAFRSGRAAYFFTGMR